MTFCQQRLTFTTTFSLVRRVRDDVVDIWERNGIANGLVVREGERRMATMITYCKNIFKVPVSRRQADFAKELQVLLDVALCQHSANETFTCDRSIHLESISGRRKGTQGLARCPLLQDLVIEGCY